MYVCAHAHICTYTLRRCTGSRGGQRTSDSPAAGVTGSSESPDLGTRNGTQVSVILVHNF